jgi:hypothetical protein
MNVMTLFRLGSWCGVGLVGLALAGCATPAAEETVSEAVAPEATASEVATQEAMVVEEPAAPAIYTLAGERFQFPGGALLQTWPVMFETPPRFARLAVQMPAEKLAPELVGLGEAVQIDLLESALIPEPNAVMQAAFADWVGRENAPAQSSYKFNITSQRGATGTRIAYLRQKQKIALDSLSPFQPQEGAPIYLVALDGISVTTLIECGPLPEGYKGGYHCSLRRPLSEHHGYRLLFPLDILSFWRELDEAAQDYVAAATQ